jgi:hypothetical protein
LIADLDPDPPLQMNADLDPVLNPGYKLKIKKISRTNEMLNFIENKATFKGIR